jgi:sugar-specific transcriptional regulator TrmB
MATVPDPVAVRNSSLGDGHHIVSRRQLPSLEKRGWVEAKSPAAKKEVAAVEAKSPAAKKEVAAVEAKSPAAKKEVAAVEAKPTRPPRGTANPSK